MWRDTLPLWPLTGVSMGWFEAAPGVVVAVGLGVGVGPWGVREGFFQAVLVG